MIITTTIVHICFTTKFLIVGSHCNHDYSLIVATIAGHIYYHFSVYQRLKYDFIMTAFAVHSLKVTV